MLALTAAALAVAGLNTQLDFKVEPFKDQCNVTMGSLSAVHGKQLAVGVEEATGFSLYGRGGQLVADVADQSLRRYLGVVGGRLLFGRKQDGAGLVGYDISNPAQPVRAFVLAVRDFAAVAGDHFYGFNGSTVTQYNSEGKLTARGGLQVNDVLGMFAFGSTPGETYVVATDDGDSGVTTKTLYAFNTSTGAVRVAQRPFLQGNGDLQNIAPLKPDAVLLKFSYVLGTFITLGPDLQPITTFQFPQLCNGLVVDSEVSLVYTTCHVRYEGTILVVAGLDTPQPEARGLLQLRFESSDSSFYAQRGVIVTSSGVVTMGSGPSMTGYVPLVGSQIDSLPYKPSQVFSLGGGMCLVGTTLLHPDGRATPTDQAYKNYLGSIGGQFYFSNTFYSSQPSIVICDKTLTRVMSFPVVPDVAGGRTLGSFVYVWSTTSSGTDFKQYSTYGGYTGVAWRIEDFEAIDMFAFSTVADAVYTCGATACFEINTRTGKVQEVALPLPPTLSVLGKGVLQLTDDLVVLAAGCPYMSGTTLFTLGPNLELVNSYRLPSTCKYSIDNGGYNSLSVDQSFSEVNQVYVLCKDGASVVVVKGLNTTQPTGWGKVMVEASSVCANRGSMIAVYNTNDGQVNNVTVEGLLPPAMGFEVEVLMDLGVGFSGSLCPLGGGMGLLAGFASKHATIEADGQIIWTNNEEDYTSCATDQDIAYVTFDGQSYWSAFNVSNPRKPVKVGKGFGPVSHFSPGGGYCYLSAYDGGDIKQYTVDGVYTGLDLGSPSSGSAKLIANSIAAFTFAAVPHTVYFVGGSSSELVMSLDTKSGKMEMLNIFNSDGSQISDVQSLPGDLQVFLLKRYNFRRLSVVDKEMNIVRSLPLPSQCRNTQSGSGPLRLQVDQAYNLLPHVYVYCSDGIGVAIARNLHTPQAAWVGFVDLGSDIMQSFYAHNGTLFVLAQSWRNTESVQLLKFTLTGGETPAPSPVPLPTPTPAPHPAPTLTPTPAPAPTPSPSSSSSSRSGLSVGAWVGICAGIAVASVGLGWFVKTRHLAATTGGLRQELVVAD